MRSLFKIPSRRVAAMLAAGLFTLIAAGCHRNNLTSGYGLMLTSLTTQRSQFTSYLVTVDYVTLTGVNVGAVTAVSVPEVIDFNRLTDVSEIWANASIPNDTYKTATITLDYTAANVSVLDGGVPKQLKVIDNSTAATATTITVTVNLDPNEPIVSVGTYATTAAVRLAISLDMGLSNVVDLAAGTVTVFPYFTMATSAPDQKLIAIRGPLINSSVNLGTYSVYVRPFYDEVNTSGTITMFADADTIFTVDGASYTGAQAGITRFADSSTGTTMTRALTTYEPTLTPSATAGIFHAKQVIAGSTLENFQTGGLEGEVVKRTGNTLTLRAPTAQATSAATVYFTEPDATITIGPNTVVTQDGTANQAGLSYNSIAVGQHIIARGIFTAGDFVSVPMVMDATSNSEAAVGSVRLIPTEVYGPVVTSASGSAVIALDYFNRFPANLYDFTGNGITDPANYDINTGALTFAAVAPGEALFVDGIVAPFGRAPPNFIATAVNTQATEPADLLVLWSEGSKAPFSQMNAEGFVVDLASYALTSATLNIGAQAIDMKTLPASPLIVPAKGTPPTQAGLPSVFLPLFGLGTPATLTVSVYNTLATYQAALTAPVTKVAAHGSYNPATNTFTASSFNVVN